MYTNEDYILFFLAIALFLLGLPLMGAIMKWWEKRKAERREYQLHTLNHREEWRRRHNIYLARMREVLTGGANPQNNQERTETL